MSGLNTPRHVLVCVDRLTARQRLTSPSQSVEAMVELWHHTRHANTDHLLFTNTGHTRITKVKMFGVGVNI